MELQTADGSPLDILGEVLIPYTFQDKTRVIPTLVAPKLTKECICGMDFWKAFGVYPSVTQICEIHPKLREVRTEPKTLTKRVLIHLVVR